MSDEKKNSLTVILEQIAGKAYDDLASGTFKQLGQLGTDAAKTLRLLLVPLQVAGAFQDRLEMMVERMRNRVPDDRRIEAPADLVVPALDRMRYSSDQSEIWKMFEEVLTKAIDKERADAIHPSFAHIIPQLSRDEAWMLYRLRDRSFNVVDTLELDRAANQFTNRVIVESELPASELAQPNQVDLYYSHLESLSLVRWPVLKQEPITDGYTQTGVRRCSRMELTDFGKLFVAACVPNEGFVPLHKKNEA